jgi:mono/diheme cytochrome c family protein
MAKKLVLGVVGSVVVIAAGAVTAGLFMKPAQRPAPDVTVQVTPERVERGRYLATSVFPCMQCHSQLDPTLYGGAPKPGTEGAGGNCLGAEAGVPGVVCVRNITPDRETGIGAWTDGEIVRAIREGVDRDGNGLFPMMPYQVFREMPDEDAFAIVAYLRTLKPIRNKVPASRVAFPVNILTKFAPKPLSGPVPPIDRRDQVAYGHYLTRACFLCHTPTDGRHQPLVDKAFSGGREFRSKDLTVRSANLTFDETGQGERTKEQFISMFAAFRDAEPMKVAPEHNTFMPWRAFSGMTDEDLGSVYDFLKAQPNIRNEVERRPVPYAG